MRGIRCDAGAVPQLYGEPCRRNSLTKRRQCDEPSQSAAFHPHDCMSLARYKMIHSGPYVGRTDLPPPDTRSGVPFVSRFFYVKECEACQ